MQIEIRILGTCVQSQIPSICSCSMQHLEDLSKINLAIVYIVQLGLRLK